MCGRVCVCVWMLGRRGGILTPGENKTHNLFGHVFNVVVLLWRRGTQSVFLFRIRVYMYKNAYVYKFSICVSLHVYNNFICLYIFDLYTMFITHNQSCAIGGLWFCSAAQKITSRPTEPILSARPIEIAYHLSNSLNRKCLKKHYIYTHGNGMRDGQN